MKRAIKGLSFAIIVLFVVISMLSNFMHNGNALGVRSSINPSSTNIQSFDSELDSVDSSQVSVHTQGCCEGYTLINSIWTELIDMNGKLIHRWRTFAPMPAKMLPGGSIIVGDKYKFFGYTCGDFKTLEELDWNGSVTWSYNGWENGRARQHHDFQLEGNSVGYYAPGQEFIPRGKTLILAHQNIRNISISRRPLIDEVIYEVDWNGSFTGFEWHASDHYDQMGFDNITKHGIYVNPGILGDGDWLHVNSMSTLGENPWYSMDPVNYSCFNPDNIIIDSRNTNFIAIISRETGDIVWRVGPDYSKNSESGRKLGQMIGSHNAHMIPKGLPGEGNILVFDNGGIAGYGYFGMPSRSRLWSRVIEFNPITFDIVWQYSCIKLNWLFPRSGEGHRFFSYYVSSAQRLPNGNTLIAEGSNGRIFEVTNKSEIVWEYVAPTRLHQIYRAYRVPPEWVPGNPAGYPLWDENN